MSKIKTPEEYTRFGFTILTLNQTYTPKGKHWISPNPTTNTLWILFFAKIVNTQ